MTKLLRIFLIIFSILIIVFFIFFKLILPELHVKSKDNYIDNYTTFVKEVRVLHDDFTDEEWEECYVKYEDFSVTKKKKHAKYFTESDIQRIDALEEEYANYLIEQEINDFIDSLGKGIQKSIKEIGDWIEGDSIK